MNTQSNVWVAMISTWDGASAPVAQAAGDFSSRNAAMAAVDAAAPVGAGAWTRHAGDEDWPHVSWSRETGDLSWSATIQTRTAFEKARRLEAEMIADGEAELERARRAGEIE